jgi:transcriptional regulator with GAF, ATPase, and Fis domain
MKLADQGTLFLDEVGDIPVEIQPKPLRAFQEGKFERLGNIHTRRVNISLNRTTFFSRMKKFGIYAKQDA